MTLEGTETAINCTFLKFYKVQELPFMSNKYLSKTNLLWAAVKYLNHHKIFIIILYCHKQNSTFVDKDQVCGMVQRKYISWGTKRWFCNCEEK